MFYKLSQESLKKIKELIGKDDYSKYISLEKFKDRKKTNEPNFDLNQFNELLKKFNLTDKNFVGKGVFSIAYEKDEKIFKFTLNRNDLLKILALQSIKSKIPEKYEKFLMEIYDFGFDEDSKFYYIIIEKLQNLQKTEKTLLLGNESPIEIGFNASTLITEDFINKILLKLKEIPDVKDYIDNILKFSSTKNILMNEVKETVEKINFVIPNSFDKSALPMQIAHNARQFGINILICVLKFIEKIFGKDLSYNSPLPMNVAKDLANDYVNFVKFPRRQISDNKTFNTKRFGGDLLEFLRFLKENYNILFNDLHTGNIMKRHSGDLVLSDVGLFEIK